MGVIIPVGQAQCVLRWVSTGDPEEMVSTIGVDPLAITDPTVLAHEVYDAAVVTGSLTPAAALNALWTFNGVTVYFQDDPGQRVGVWTAPLTGIGATHVTPPTNCALLVKKFTALSGRANRGRMFLPPFGIGEGDVNNNGVILGATYTTLQNRINEFETQLNSIPVTPVLFHSTPVDSTPLTALVLDTQIATQRRRMRP